MHNISNWWLEIYLKQHKSFKYVKKHGVVGKSRVGEKMQNRELSRGQSVDFYITSWQWRMRSRATHITHVK